jgi:hypothetical protein
VVRRRKVVALEDRENVRGFDRSLDRSCLSVGRRNSAVGLEIRTSHAPVVVDIGPAALLALELSLRFCWKLRLPVLEGMGLGCAALGHRDHEQAGRKAVGLGRRIRAVAVGRHIVADLDSPGASRRRHNSRR